MQKCRCCRCDHTRNSKHDQPGIKPYDKTIISVNPFHKKICKYLQCHNLIQTVRIDRNICDLSGNLRTITDRDACICC